MKPNQIYRIMLLFMGMFSGSVILHGQDLREDLKKSYEAYAKMQDYSCDVKVGIYKTEEYTKPYMTLSGHILKGGNRYFSQFEKNTLVLNDKYMIYVDEEGKYIYYKDLDKLKDKKKALENPYDPQMLQKSLDSALIYADSIHYNGAIKGANEYYIKSRKLISMMTIDIDIQTHLITKLVYYYNKRIMKENNKVTIEFTNMTTKPVIAEDAFSEKRYIIIDGRKVALVAKYATYDLIDDEPKSKR